MSDAAAAQARRLGPEITAVEAWLLLLKDQASPQPTREPTLLHPVFACAAWATVRQAMLIKNHPVPWHVHAVAICR